MPIAHVEPAEMVATDSLSRSSPEPRVRLVEKLRTLLTRRCGGGVDQDGRDDLAGAEQLRLRRLDEMRVVLDRAHAVIERGWLQDAWFAIRDRSGRLRPVGPLTLAVPRNAPIAAACLVGAVVHAGHAVGGSPDATSRTLDLIWTTLHDVDRTVGRGISVEPLGAAPHHVRTARVRDLTRWNDAESRDREEVLDLLDRASSRVITEAMAAPAPTGSLPRS